MDVLKKFMSKDGRLSRKGYVLCFVLPGAALLASTVASFWFVPPLVFGPGLQVLSLGWVVYLSTIDAQNIRRYHDLGNSGGLYRAMRPLVVLLPILAFALQFLIPAQLASAGDMEALAFLIGQEVAFRMSPIPLAVMVLWFVGILANIVYLAVTPGQTGPNAYGPDPDGGAGVFLPTAGTDDPVERALGEYRARLAQPQPVSARTTASPPKPAGSFGKKR